MVLSRAKAAAAAAGWNRAACVSESSHLLRPILFCRQECSQQCCARIIHGNACQWNIVKLFKSFLIYHIIEYCQMLNPIT